MTRAALLAACALLWPLAAAAAPVLCFGDTECRSDGACNQADPIEPFQLERRGNGLVLAFNRPGSPLRDRLGEALRDRLGQDAPGPGTRWNGPGRAIALAPLGAGSYAGTDDGRDALLLTLTRSGRFVLTRHRGGQRPSGSAITGGCEGLP